MAPKTKSSKAPLMTAEKPAAGAALGSDASDSTEANIEASPDASAVEAKVTELRVNFGAPKWLTRSFLEPGGWARNIIYMVLFMFVPFFKLLLFVVGLIPWTVKHTVTMKAWQLWLALHHRLPPWIGRRGMSDELSLEAHALHNVLWWARLFPAPVWVIRFALSELGSNFDAAPPAQWIDSEHTPGLRSAYIPCASLGPAKSEEEQKKRPVLFWVFGGAFLGGDVKGNCNPAAHYGRALGCDVFVVDMRLCPEYEVADAVIDAYRGYLWLLTKVPAENVIMLGISSGGGVVTRLAQLAAASDAERAEYFTTKRGKIPPAAPQPAGAVLLGPAVDFTSEVTGPMIANCDVDLILSTRMVDAVMPYMLQLVGGEDRLKLCSPMHNKMEGLCPLLVSASEHEGLLDDDRRLVKKAQESGVNVEFFLRPFMPHVYHLLANFLPEAAAEELKIMDWMRRRGGVWCN